MTTSRLSDPSKSVSADVMFNSIAESSAPETLVTVTVGASATPPTLTLMFSVVLAVSAPSADVTVTARSKSASESGAGVIVRPGKSSAERVQVLTPSITDSVPPFRMAPSGTPVIVTSEIVSESSLTEAVISSAIAVSSRPDASATFSVGTSASGSTETAIVPTTLSLSAPSPSVDVTVTVRVKSSSESVAGVT